MRWQGDQLVSRLRSVCPLWSHLVCCGVAGGGGGVKDKQGGDILPLHTFTLMRSTVWQVNTLVYSLLWIPYGQEQNSFWEKLWTSRRQTWKTNYPGHILSVLLHYTPQEIRDLSYVAVSCLNASSRQKLVYIFLWVDHGQQRGLYMGGFING